MATVANAGGYSTTAIRAVGAEPIYIDIEPYTMNMSAASLLARLTPDVRAVIATHLYGHMADLPALLAVTCRAGVPLIEDCAQAHGAAIGGRKAGSWGALACFSFYPTKNLGALGDGGAITTNDAHLAHSVKSLRQYGWSSKYQSSEYGRNSRMDEMQAAILRAKLPHLDGWNARRREIASTLLGGPRRPTSGVPAGFRRGLRRAPLRDPQSRPRSGSRRAQTRAASRRISTIPFRIICRKRHGAPWRLTAELPVTEQAAREVLTLPCYAELRGRRDIRRR